MLTIANIKWAAAESKQKTKSVCIENELNQKNNKSNKMLAKK